MLEPKIYEFRKSHHENDNTSKEDEFLACMERVKRLADDGDINVQNKELLESIDRYLNDIEKNDI